MRHSVKGTVPEMRIILKSLYYSERVHFAKVKLNALSTHISKVVCLWLNSGMLWSHRERNIVRSGLQQGPVLASPKTVTHRFKKTPATE